MSCLLVQPLSGWKEINRHVKCLESNHFQDMMVYGSNRAPNYHSKVAPCQPFSWALEGRNASLRIPHATLANKQGYYEDRRPAANMDPYLVRICATAFSLPGKHGKFTKKQHIEQCHDSFTNGSKLAICTFSCLSWRKLFSCSRFVCCMAIGSRPVVASAALHDTSAMHCVKMLPDKEASRSLNAPRKWCF